MKKLIVSITLLVSTQSFSAFPPWDDSYASDPYVETETLDNDQFLAKSRVETEILGLNGCFRAKIMAKQAAEELCSTNFRECDEISTTELSSHRAVLADENFYLSIDPGSCSYESIYKGVN